MHLHVLGLGSVGCLLAHHLRQILPPAHSISLIHKTYEHRMEFLKKGSISVERDGIVKKSEGEFLHENFFKEGSPSSPQPQPEPRSHIQTIFVALKAQHTGLALTLLAPRITPNSTIVLMQNGMGIYEELLNKVFRNPTQRPHFVIASNTHGAFCTERYHVVHAGMGSIEFGIPPDHGRDYEAGLDDTKLPVEERRLRLSDIVQPSDPEFQKYKSLRETTAAFLLTKPLNISWIPYYDLRLAMKRKLVVNAAVNSLTSIMSCRNGDLFAHRPALDILSQVCTEASTVFAAQDRLEIDLRIKELKDQGIDTTKIEIPSFPDSLSKKSLEEDVLRISSSTQGNISSMLQDIRRGRRTEIQYINGYLVKLGQELGIETPTISMLQKLVELKYFLPVEGML